MKKLALFVLPVVVTAFAVVAVAGPANADTTGNTPVTVEVNGGPLNISVPAGPVALGTVPVSGSDQTVSASLGNVTVTDVRGGTEGWTATVFATDFTGAGDISVSTPGSVDYSTPQAQVTGVANVSPTSADHLYPGSAVQTATGVSGANSATWNPTLSVVVPADALAGTYSATITHSVS